MTSIIISNLNILEYLKLCIERINKYSKYRLHIISHVNFSDKEIIKYLKVNTIFFFKYLYNFETNII